MESMMFDTSQSDTAFSLSDTIIFNTDSLPTQDTLRDHCLGSADLWVQKRRANMPYLPSRRLPAVVGTG